MNLVNGLLGLGGFNGIGGTQPQLTGLLGQYYNPQDLKKAKLKAGLLNAGIALLSQKPELGQGIGTSLGAALRGGAEGAQQAQADYMNNAKFAYDLNRQATMDDRASQEWQRKLDSWKASDAQKAQLQEIIKTLDPEMQAAAMADPETFFSEYSKHLIKKQFPDPMEPYTLGYGQRRFDSNNNIVAEGPDKPGGLDGNKAGLQLQYWTDENKVLHAGQLLENGGIKEIPLPPNAQWAPGMGYLDTATGYKPYNKRSGVDPAAPEIRKDIQGKAIQEAVGENTGKQIASAPGDMQAAQLALDTIAQIRSNSYLDRGTGASSMFNSIPGTGGYDFQNLVEQAKSGAFLTAIQQMRGLGSLSNAEGEGATKAVTRMNTATSKEAFLKALDDYEAYVKKGYNRAASRIGQPQMATDPVAAPSSPLGNDPLGLR